MTSTARALGEMILRRHRWGLGTVAAGWAILAAAVTVAPAASADVTGLALIFLSVGACYLVGVFALGFDTDVAGAGSCYPPRLFALPVRTEALVGWPVAFGVAALTLLWLASAGLVFRPWGLKAPLYWPMMLIAAQYVWLLAIVWWPFGLAWARLLVALFLGHLPASGAIYAFQTGEPLANLIVFLSALLVIGSTVAYLGVRRARSGLTVRWDWLPQDRFRSSLAWRPQRPFGSVKQAQAWFEWRRHGRGLPILLALALPLYLLLFFVDDPEPARLVRNILLVLAQPVFFAGMAGTMVGKHNAWVRDYYGVPSFTATRPVTTTAMVAAMLQAAVRTTLAAWAVTIGMLVAAIVLSGTHGEVVQMWRSWSATRPVAEVIGAVVTAAILLPLLTWKRLVESLLVGLTGREWVIKGSVFVGVSFFFTGLGLVLWLLTRPEYHAPLLEWLPWALACWAIVRFAVTARVVIALRRYRLVNDSTLWLLGSGWAALVGTLSALLVWLIPGGIVSPWTVALTVVLMTPLARLSAMPLALDWNRHR